jgi:hypothetical protein
VQSVARDGGFDPVTGDDKRTWSSFHAISPDFPNRRLHGERDRL